MARVPGNKTKIYVDEWDFSGRVSSIELPIAVTLPEVTCFGDSAAEFVEGKPNVTLSQNSFFDPADNNIDEEMWTDLASGGEHNVGVYPGSSGAIQYFGYELRATTNSQGRPAEVAGAILLNVNWQAVAPIVRSTVIVNQAITGTGVPSGAEQTLGTTAAGQKFVAIVRCLAFTGSSLTVDVEESTDNGVGDAYTLISGLQQVVTAVGHWRLTSVAATENWKRVRISAFSGTTMTMVITLGNELGVS